MLLRATRDRIYEDRLGDTIPEERWDSKSAELSRKNFVAWSAVVGPRGYEVRLGPA